jgi:serine/threonine-protein kinase
MSEVFRSNERGQTMTSAPASSPAYPALPSDEVPHLRAPRALPLPGEFVGPYRLIFELASGGMATIYVALAEGRAGAHRLVAVKRLHGHLASDANFRKMFFDEARIASHIRHPNVCAVFDYDERGDTPYIVMEYLAGEPVSAVFRALPRPGTDVEKRRRCVLAARIVADACEALHAAHELRSIYGEPLNVVHRDVSPENLVVTYDGFVKLCDFGIATAERQEHETETGMLKGKYGYIQPEALRGERPDRRSDIFSLGVVLWELMTGDRLFRRESAIETLRAVGEGVVRAPSSVVGVGSEFDAAVLRALAADPGERFANAREFGKALDAGLAVAGCKSGIAEVSEWIEELFPGGRTKKEQTIELIATLYDPTRSTAMRGSDAGSCDLSGTLTVAVPQPVPPRSSIGPAIARAPVSTVPWPTARWRRPLFTFALGALLGAQYFAGSPQAWSGASKAQARVAPHAPATTIAAADAPDGTRPVNEPVSCDPKATAGALPRPDATDEVASVGESSKAARDRGRGKRDGRRGVPRGYPPIASDVAVPTLIAPPPKLELGSEFAGYAPMRLPPSLLAPQRNASDLAVR